jgi:hypothetical protein
MPVHVDNGEHQMARISLLIIACLTLVGCASTPRQFATPLSCGETGRPCEVNIINPTCATNPCSAEVDVDPITFLRGKHNIKVRWILPDGFGFCTQARDGVFLKEPDKNDQFEDPGTDGPAGAGVCKRGQFRLTAKNTVSGLQFPYMIQFHNAAGTRVYVIDPVMFNE